MITPEAVFTHKWDFCIRDVQNDMLRKWGTGPIGIIPLWMEQGDGYP